MDPKNPNREIRSTPQYALYQRENFRKTNEGETALFNTDPGNLEVLANTKLTENGWFYTFSNAGQSHTHTANRQAFYRHRIIPRMLVDSSYPQHHRQQTSATPQPQSSVTTSPPPIGFAPIGINKIYSPSGELPVARATGELGLPHCLSTAGSQPIEDVGKANDDLAGEKVAFGSSSYICRTMTSSLEVFSKEPSRAASTACILTLDTWQLAWRHSDVHASNYAFYHGIGTDLGLSDPVFQKRLREHSIDSSIQPNEAGALWIDNVRHGRGAYMGQDEVSHAAVEGDFGWQTSLLAEFDILLNVVGYRNVGEIDRNALESGSKDYPLLPVTWKL